ncbi:MAG: TMEM198/TM7SF3 family protein [Chloroflexi bacterium]|nr:MAG: TMEM198/TM7SF3 family protein [Chloroflexota bacterium]
MLFIIIGSGLIVYGIINLLWGARWFITLIVIQSFFAAAGVVTFVTGGNFILGFIAGIINAIFSVIFHFIGVFALGVILGAMIAVILSDGVPSPSSALLLSLSGGALTIMYRKHMIIWMTAFLGSAFVVAGGLLLLAGTGILEDGEEVLNSVENAVTLISTSTLVAWGLIGISGAVYQYGGPQRIKARLTRPKRKHTHNMAGTHTDQSMTAATIPVQEGTEEPEINAPSKVADAPRLASDLAITTSQRVAKGASGKQTRHIKQKEKIMNRKDTVIAQWPKTNHNRRKLML